MTTTLAPPRQDAPAPSGTDPHAAGPAYVGVHRRRDGRGRSSDGRPGIHLGQWLVLTAREQAYVGVHRRDEDHG